MYQRPLVYRIAAIICLMAVLLIWLATMARPASEMTRLRNAMLLDVGQAQDFNWTPANIPQSFRQETSKLIPQPIQSFAAQFSNENDWEGALEMASGLRGKANFKGEIQSSTVDTLNEIQDSGRGYCADFTQVMNALAYSSEIPIREWGMSFDGFGGWGHAFNEVYIDEMSKWVFLDVFQGFYVTDTNTGEPLSAMEFRESLLVPEPEIQIQRLAGRFGFKSDEDALAYYRRGMDQFYLWWGNDSLSYDSSSLINLASSLGRPVEQLTAIVLGIHPRIRVLPLPENEAMRSKMISVKYQLYFIALAMTALGILFLIQLYKLWRLTRTQNKN